MGKRALTGSEIGLRRCLLLIALFLFAWVMDASLAPVPAWAAGNSSLSASTASLAPQDDGKTTCEIADVASGQVTWDPSTRTVTMNNATIDLDRQSGYLSAGIAVNAQLEQTKPTVNLVLVGTNTIKGGSYDTPINVRYANLAVKGAGTLNTSTATTFYDIKVEGSFTASSGKLNLQGGDYGIYCDGNAVFNGGSVTMRNLDDFGVYCGGSVTVTKGSLTVDGAGLAAISAKGKVKISGGKVTAKCSKVNDYFYPAISADGGITNKASCLKAVRGSLGKGATFQSGGSTYAVSSTGSVTLKSYGSSSKKPNVNSMSFGGVKYRVEAIGAKAFSTKKGKAITSLTLGSNVRKIGADAFYGTSKLTKLNVKNFYYFSASMNKKAFRKCGKSGGAELKVLCASYTASQVEKKLSKAGMSKKAKYV